MNGVEYGFPESRGDKGASGTVAAIDYEVVATDADAFEVQPGSDVVSEASEFGIQGLLSCYSTPVDAQVGDRVYDACQVFASGRCA